MRRNRHGNARAGGQRPGTPVLASAGLWNCTVTQEGLRPSCGTRWKRTPALRLYASSGSDNAPDNPCCYFASLPPPFVPFPSDGFAACSTKGGVGERIEMEWVFDKSFLDFSLYTYIFILLRWIIRRRFSRQRIIRRRKRQQRCKAGKAHQSCLARCRFYRAEAGIIVQTSKVVNR